MKIDVRDLDFSYKDNSVLRELSFSADAGDVMAVLGPNGVGKSTLFRCLLGFIRPQRGTITVGGEDIRSLGSSQLARRVAYIPQSTSPAFNYTVQDTVLMGLTNQLGMLSSPRPADVKKVADVLESLGILHLRHRGCGQISGGERQLTLLARALIQNASVLVMDEPTANLDYGNSWRVMERIVSLAESGYTVIYSTHDPNQAFMHANRVLALKNGAALAVGAPGDALSEAVLSELYNIRVFIRRVPYNGGEALVSLPGGESSAPEA
jgi:iron complex transport system ATP-binding protein